MNKRLLLGTCLLALNGCMSALFPYEKPETPQPETFREAVATDTTNAAVIAWPDEQWWQQFGNPELTTLMETALKNNNDIGAAVARVRQANALVTINRAPLLPSIDLTGNATHTDSGGNGVTTVAGGIVSTSGGGSSKGRLNAGLNASYEVDFWGKNYSGLQAAQASRAASEYDAQVVRLTVTSSVANVYFDLLATEQRLAIAKENLANANELLVSLKKRFENGIISELDVTQQESVVASQNAAIPALELQRSKDLDALALLVGSLPESLNAPKSNFSALAIPQVPEGLSSGLLQRRPDVHFAEANLMAAHADINAARAAFFPSITLTGSAGYASTALNSLFQPSGFLNTVGLGLAQPIFKGGALLGQLDLSKAQYDELLQNYHKAVLAAFSDTEDSLAAVKQNIAQQAAQEDVLRAAEKAYSLSQQQFQGGIIDITTVLNTQRTLFSARDALTQAKLGRMQAIAGLYKSFGGGWQAPVAE